MRIPCPFSRLALPMLLMAVGAAAQTPAERPPPEGPAETLTIHLDNAKPWTGDLDGMIERRVIRVLTVNSKTFYFVDQGVQRGVVVDAFRVFEDDLNRQLAAEGRLKNPHLKVRVVFIPVHHDRLLDDLASGFGDVAAANLTVTPDRERRVDFARASLGDVSELVVTGPASPAIATLDDLSGRAVFVRRSSSQHESLVALSARFEAEGRAPIRFDDAPETLEDSDLLEMLNAGLVGLVVVDRHVADFWRQVFPRIVVDDTLRVRSGGEIAWAMRKDSPLLKARLDAFADRARAGTAIGDRLLKRYLQSARYVKNATDPEEREKLQSLTRYFQKYGQRYRIDWLLIAAQGYQESRLDQDARSPAGAIGVMQLMPATGDDMDVGDITDVEPNIHAGVKYMRWMIDTYFEREPMTPLDKALFAFAAYNAGPGRIAAMRKGAAKRGLDPDVWFQNVEYLAAEQIGAETVTYVSNIYKYYIGYRLTLQDQADAKADKDALRDRAR